MTMEELQAALTECDRKFVDQSGVRPILGAHLSLRQNGQWEADIYLGCDEDLRPTGKGSTPEEAITALRAVIDALPSREEQQLDEFRRDLAKLIDKGNAYGIDASFVNPLSIAMRRLSENALTADPADNVSFEGAA